MTMTTDASTDPAGTTPPTGPIYRLTAITKTYSQKGRSIVALKGVDLDLQAGDFVAVQGPTGGGKSTFLQLLGALDRPTSGSIALGGTELSNASDAALGRLRATEIGFVFQGFNLIPTLTAIENVEMALEPLHVPAADRRRRAAEALAQVQLADRQDHLPGELSGGQQQRVAIARAIVKDPRVLLADEPTGNLDEQTRDEIMAVLTALNATGLTLVVVTHDSHVARMAQRRLRLKQGAVTELAT
ncbi:ABC transporter ATP-binding protein [Microbacterium sp. P03]|uniref:ABC transporter ATP-binding protein n=1 Tax=Microbacterium sp. P03 TaxID=3366946 RepID=UPI0037475C59